MSRLNSSIQLDLPRNLPRNSLDCMKSLHVLAPIQSPYNFWTVFALFTQFSMSPCWSQQPQIWFLIVFNLHPCQSPSMTNWNLKSPKSSTPRLTTTVVPASYCILSVGQGMRALMKKNHGSLLQNLDMLLNSLWISTLHNTRPLALHLILCSPLHWPLNLRLNSKYWTLTYHGISGPQTSTLSCMKYLDFDNRQAQHASWSQHLRPSEPEPQTVGSTVHW